MNDPGGIEYVIPVRWDTDEDLHEFTAYLRQLTEVVDVTVVDGCDEELFAAHSLAWPREFGNCGPADGPAATARPQVW